MKYANFEKEETDIGMHIHAPSQVQMPPLSQEELEEIRISKTLSYTLQLINDGEKQLSNQTAEEAILLIGRTGVGKSTLVNYLANPENVHAIYYKDSKVKWGKGKLVLDVKNPKDSLAKPGHKMDSETTVPNRWESNKVLYWDCPGFDHTDDPAKTTSQDIANAFFIKKIFDITTNVKVLLVITWDDLNAGRADKIKAITDQLGNLFVGKDFENILNGLSLIVTKAQGQDQDDIKGKLDEARHSECFKGKSTGKDIIEFLLESEGRIATFNIPKHEGSIFEGENAAILGPKKHNEVTMVVENAKFVNRPHVNIAVAKDSILAVENIAKAVNNKVIELLADVCEEMEESYKNWSSKVIKSVNSIDVIVHLINFLGLLGKSVDELVVETSKDKTVSGFVHHLQEQQNIIRDNLIVNQSTLLEIAKNIEHIEFFKQINRNAEKNIRLDEWIGRFKDFNKALTQNIEAIKSELQDKFNDGNSNLDGFIEQLLSYVDKLSGECFKTKNYVKYKEYVKNFEKLSELMSTKDLNSYEVVKYLNTAVIKTFDLDNKWLEKVRISDEFNRAIDFKETAKTYETKLKSELKLFCSKAQACYKDAIKDFSQITSFEVKNSLKTLIDKLYDHVKALRVQEELEDIGDALEKIVEDLKEIKDLNIPLKSLEALFKKCQIKQDLITQTYHNIDVLHQIIAVENSFYKIEVELIGEYMEGLDKISKNDIPSFVNKLSGDLIIEAEKNINDTIAQFINKVTIFASQNKDNVASLISSFEQYLSSIRNEIDIVKSIEELKTLIISNVPNMDLKPLNHILAEIKKVETHKDLGKVLEKIHWNQKIEGLAKDIIDTDNALVKQQLGINLQYLFDEIIKDVEYNVPNMKDIYSMSQSVSKLYSLFPNMEELAFKINNVGKLAEELINIIHNSGLNLKPVKDGLSEIKDKTTTLDDSIKLKIGTLTKYLKEETSWYDAIRKSIYNEISSPAFVFDSSNKDYYKTLDQSKFLKLLDKSGVNSTDVPYTQHRCDQLQKLVDVTLGSSSNVSYSNGKYILTGNFVKISDVINSSGSNNFIEVIASESVYFDITSISSSVGLSIIAPRWYMPNSININLNGSNGYSYGYYDKASDGSSYGAKGSNGSCGYPGTSAGHFYGIIGHEISNCVNDLSMLRVTANGGDGGRGQGGGNGYKGADGSDAGSVPSSGYSRYEVDDKNTCHLLYRYYLDGTKGSTGGNGGDAGYGGNGGYAGTIKLFKNGNNDLGCKITSSASSGSTGDNGTPGSGASGGRNGDTTMDKYLAYGGEKGCTYEGHSTGWYRGNSPSWSGDYYHYQTNGYASNGSSGSVSGNPSKPNNNEPDFRSKVSSTKADFANLVISKEQNSNDFGVKVQLPMLREFYTNVQLSGNGLANIEYKDLGYDQFFNKYYGEGIDEILKLRLASIDKEKLDLSKVKALHAEYMFDGYNTNAENIVADVLNTMLQDGSTKVLVPYNNENKHWVGIIFELGDDEIVITYFDPENNPAPQKLVEKLVSIMDELSIKVAFNELLVPTQTAGNCGPEIIEDFIQYFTGDRLEESEVVPYHAQLVMQQLLGEHYDHL